MAQLRLFQERVRARRRKQSIRRARRPRWKPGPRWPRCAEDGCGKRARKHVDGERVCRAHATWHRRCCELSILRGEPPPSLSRLGRWVTQQKQALALEGGAPPALTVRQKALLQSIPRWDRTWAEFKQERAQEERWQREQQGRELEVLQAHDIDAAEVDHHFATLVRDRELLRMAKEDKRRPYPPRFRFTSTRRSTRLARRSSS